VQQAAPCSVGHSGLLAVQKEAYPFARCLAGPAADSAAHSAVGHCWADQAGSAAAHCPAALRSRADCFVEHCSAEHSPAVAAWADSRSAAGLGDCLHLAVES
jgi:hypothetical protein